jgi:hypothetical protein
MPKLFKKGDFSFSGTCQLQFNGILKFAGTVKTQVFDGFRDVNQERVDTMLVTEAHKNRPVEDAYAGFVYVTLKYIASVIGIQWGDRIQNFKLFGLSRDY